MMGGGEGVMPILAKPIQLADQVTKLADDARLFRSECQELKSKSEYLATILRRAARKDLYERPARRIMDDTEQALEKALTLVSKCRNDGFFRRVFTMNPVAAFRKMSTGLDNSIGDVSWLLRVSASEDEDGDNDGDTHLGLPPIAQNDPILCLIWAQIANLLRASNSSSLKDRFDSARIEAAATLSSLARDNERYGKLIIEEDGIGPLLRLVKEGPIDARENAARAIGFLGRDPESIEQMVVSGVCSVFSKVLKDSPMKIQAVVAWAISELAANHPQCQEVFAQNNVVRLLVGHLAFETIQEHSKYAIPPKSSSIHAVITAATNAPAKRIQQFQNVAQCISIKGGRELEEPATKVHAKAMAARALWQLARGNASICKIITESKALLCFSVLLENGEAEVRYYSAMAVMEISRVAEDNADLRHSAFKCTSPTARSIVDQLLHIIKKAEEYDELLVPCVTALGCLSRTFRATERRVVGPLVGLLDRKEAAVKREAVLALTKFACTENYLHVGHSKAIIEASGVEHLVLLIQFDEQTVQLPALLLLSYIALHVPKSEKMAQFNVRGVFEYASKQPFVLQNPYVDALLRDALRQLELFQSRPAYH